MERHAQMQPSSGNANRSRCRWPKLRRRYPIAILAWSFAWVTVAAETGAVGPAADQRTLIVEQTLEAAPGYPRVHVQLSDGNRILQAAPQASPLEGLQGLDELQKLLAGATGPSDSFMAFLDTGATAHVLSVATARRFGVQVEPGAVYFETGLHGPTPMGVSRPYGLALGEASGQLMDEPGRFGTLQQQAVFLLNQRDMVNPLIQMTLGSIDVIGMPAIRGLVIEFDPSPMEGLGRLLGLDTGSAEDALEILTKLDELGVGPAVRLHPPDHVPAGVDIEIPLTFVDFAYRKNPDNRGPTPDLAANPMLSQVRTVHGDLMFQGDWLLDTGAPVSIISTRQAKALGLVDEQGRPFGPPQFTLPMGGVGGQVAQVPGFRVDRLSIAAGDNLTLEYRSVHVVVHDVMAMTDQHGQVTLDGVWGTNLLFPSVSGLGLGLPSRFAPAPFGRIWLDGPRGRLLLQWPRADTTAP